MTQRQSGTCQKQNKVETPQRQSSTILKQQNRKTTCGLKKMRMSKPLGESTGERDNVIQTLQITTRFTRCARVAVHNGSASVQQVCFGPIAIRKQLYAIHRNTHRGRRTPSEFTAGTNLYIRASVSYFRCVFY